MTTYNSTVFIVPADGDEIIQECLNGQLPSILGHIFETREQADEFVAWRKNRPSVDQIAAKDAEIAQLRSENDQWRTWGVVEIAVRNPNAASYMEHWEGRATKAEAENAALRERVAALEALASKWATDAPLSERRTLTTEQRINKKLTMHEASVAYRKAAGVFPNPDGVKAILDK